MNLTYRGIAYSSISPSIEVAPTEQTASFLGKASAQKQYEVAQRRPQQEELTFLGRRYSR